MARTSAAGTARRVGWRVGALVLACAVVAAFPAGAVAEQASEPASHAAGGLDTDGLHSCALLAAGNVRCWGYGASGQLGYGNTDTVGDDETPASVGPVNLGAGHVAVAIAAGDYHTCALLDDGSVRCWGFGGDGRLGYGNTNDVLDPSSVGAVNLGPGHTAKAITAGAAHTCALLDDGSVRCWGFGGGGFPRGDGRLGYGNTNNVGDTPATTPDKAGEIKLGLGRSAVAISAGGAHTCAILDDGHVRCWGVAATGQLGYGNTNNVGSLPTTTPDTAGPVNLGPGRTARAISAGEAHTCAVLDDGSVRCWGDGGGGRLGYGNTNNVGDTPTTTPNTAGPVNLGPGRTAQAISSGGAHSCAILDDGNLRCWGLGESGRLGYGNINNIGDTQTPASAGPVDLGPGRSATAISAGKEHTCARLDDNRVRCWGLGAYARLGYCSESNVGDMQTPGSVGPVNLEPGDGGAGCPSPPNAGGPPGVAPATTPANGAEQTTVQKAPPMVDADAARARGLRSCLAGVRSHVTRERGLAPRGSGHQRAKTRRHLARRAARGRRRCLRIYGRTPGPVTGLRGTTVGDTVIKLYFNAPGTDANRPPPAHSYLVKQSLRPIRGAPDFARAQTLCRGSCRFAVSQVGAKVSLTVTNLRPHTTYYYAVVARDNVSARDGPRSHTVKVSTR